MVKLKNNFSKKLILFIPIIAVIASFWFIRFKTSANAPIMVITDTTQVVNDAFKSLVKQQYITPKMVVITSIGVEANVEPVGVEAGGAMEVPHNFSNIGWLKTSSKLGQNGNLVLSGHYDNPTGAPAVFYNLANVSQGDIISVLSQTQSGALNQKDYAVTKVYMADPTNTDHVREAFRTSNHPIITLITCNGIWDPVKGEYSHRVVVKGELVE